MNDPFDTSKPSPIEAVRELFARAPGAVVGVEGMTELQTRAYIPSRVEDRLAALLTDHERPDLVVISGSAGYGKSALIDRIERAHPGVFEEVIQDATHSDSPSQSQADRLVEFFAPFDDGRPAPGERPRIIAANTGMLIQFFRSLRDAGDDRFRDLEALLKFRLGISIVAPPATNWTVAVINLDLRPTTGPDGLMKGMLRLLDFSNPDGLLEGAPRCETCRVRAFCPVRSNSIVAHRVASPALDALASQAATERARYAGPRQLYDFVARVLTGDDAFDGYDDPCQAVADAARRKDLEWVSRHLIARTIFELGGELGSRIAGLDPSLTPSARAHGIMSNAGLVPDDDALAVASLDPGDADAVKAVAARLSEGVLSASERAHLARVLVAADFLANPGKWDIGDEVAREFAKARAAYDALSRRLPADLEPLETLRRLIERALAHTFGVLDGQRPFIPVKAYDPRDPSRIFVSGALENEEGSFQLIADPGRTRDPDGAELVGHNPLAITIKLGGVELAITLPVYRLLWQAAGPTLASTADLERFYGLRHAVEALGRRASENGRDLMIERPESSRHYMVQRVKGISGQESIAVRELGR